MPKKTYKGGLTYHEALSRRLASYAARSIPAARARAIAISRPFGAGELKYIDITVFTAPVKSTQNGGCAWQMNPLSYILRGTDNTQRIGRQITVKSVEWQITVAPTPGAPGNVTYPAMTCKAFIVRDAESTREIAAAQLSNVGVGGADGVLVANELTECNAVAFTNLDNRKRYTTLYSRTFVLDPYTTGAASSASDAGTSKHLHIYKPMNHKVTYGQSAAAGEFVSENAVYLYLLGTNYSAITPPACPWQATGACRVRFTDE